MSRSAIHVLTAALAAVLLCAAPAAAEVFHLRSGGIIEGRAKDGAPGALRVELHRGCAIGLQADEIARVQVLPGPADFLRWMRPAASPPPDRPLANPLPHRPCSAPVLAAAPRRPRPRARYVHYESTLYDRLWLPAGRSYVLVQASPSLSINGRLVRAAQGPRVVIWRAPFIYRYPCDPDW